ncbi:glycosyltransferase family 2 protein [Cetobacterium sp.]|uniref:glycosyltransferase family 2 protein n=1 Tax=Cetobacterium sp. TaxID=2071632 RepID=UPI003F31A8BB
MIKISIIVPVYKVEPYLRKCIDSILAQTFKDFELILVDDGSPDSCGDICDEYAKKDKRIKVIHKKNGGQSSARNAGLDIAEGEYIGFVDSDDWIETDMYEILYNLCVANNCEISCISSKIIYPEKIIIRDSNELKKYTRDEAMKELIRGKVFDEVVWTKLFKKQIMKGFRFKEGIKYEDTDFTYKIVYRCNSLVYLGKPVYNYLKREGSTMANALEEISIDHIYIYDEMFKFYKQKYPKYKDMVLLRIIDSGLPVLNNIIKNSSYNKKKIKFNEVNKILNDYFFDFLKIKEINRNIKLLLILLRINPYLYINTIKILEKKK